ncbi:hypothetical protein PV326_003350 [Microctonus aethiopoides]|nr:hypothetical protein PV326_003350 [Microctonus aethiopoides]
MTESTQSTRQNVARSISPSLSASTSDDPTKSLQQQILSTEAKIDTFVNRQTIFNNKLSEVLDVQNTKLTEIKNITKDVSELKHAIVDMSMQSSSEIIISDVPAQLGFESKVVVENTLKALDAEHLVSDVLDIRPVNSKNKTILGDADRRMAKLSYIVQFNGLILDFDAPHHMGDA